MGELDKYNIDIFSLAEKEYNYHYSSDSAFFEALPQDLIQNGRFEVMLLLHKTSTMIRLDFSVEAVVEQVCDRSSEVYEEQVQTNNRLFLKFGERDEELTDEIEMIQRNTARINVAKYIYDFLALALPVKRLHPRFREEDEGEGDLLVYSATSEEESSGDTKVDPRWEALKRLK